MGDAGRAARGAGGTAAGRLWAWALLLLLLAPVTAFSLDVAQIQQDRLWRQFEPLRDPWVSEAPEKAGVNWYDLALGPVSADAPCASATVRIQEQDASTFLLRYRISLPAGHPLAQAVVQGEAREQRESFLASVVGWVHLVPGAQATWPGTTDGVRPLQLVAEPPTVEQKAGPQGGGPCRASEAQPVAVIRSTARVADVGSGPLSLLLLPPGIAGCAEPCQQVRTTFELTTVRREVEALRLVSQDDAGDGNRIVGTPRTSVHEPRRVVIPPNTRDNDAVPHVVLSGLAGSQDDGFATEPARWLPLDTSPGAPIPRLWSGAVSVLAVALAAWYVRPSAISGSGAVSAATGGSLVLSVTTGLAAALLMLAGLRLSVPLLSALSDGERTVLDALWARGWGGFPSVSGALLLLLSALAVLWPGVAGAAWHCCADADRRRHAQLRSAVALLLGLMLLAAVAMLLVSLAQDPTQFAIAWPDADALTEAAGPLLATTAAAGATWLLGAVVVLAVRPPRPWASVALFGALAVVLATLAPLTLLHDGRVPTLLAAVPAAVAVSALLALAGLVLRAHRCPAHEHGVTERAEQAIPPPRTRRSLASLGIAAATLLVVLSWPDREARFSSLYSTYDVAYPLGGLTVPAAVLLLVLWIERRRRDTTPGGALASGEDEAAEPADDRRAVRATALALALLALAPVPSTRWGPLPLAFLVSWWVFDRWLFPRDRVDARAEPVEPWSSALQTARADELANAIDARTNGDPPSSLAPAPAVPSSSSTTPAPPPKGAGAWREWISRLVRSDTPSSSSGTGSGGTVSLVAPAAGSGAARPASAARDRARRAARVKTAAAAALGAPGPTRTVRRQAALAGLVLGLPWLAVSPAIMPDLSASERPGQLVLQLTLWLLSLARWMLIGYLFGHAFPVMRGSTGLWKSVVLLTALSVSPAVALLTGALTAKAAALAVAQTAAVCLPMGLAADWWTLWRCGHGWGEVQALYRLRFLASWGTAVTAAVAGALSVATTTTFTELGKALVQREPQQQAPAPLDPSPTPTPR